MKIIGLVGKKEFTEISEYFLSKNTEMIIMDPMRVFGEMHVISAMNHAKRSFEYGTNRSKTIITEFLLYMAGERQISKALEKMKPKNNGNFVIVFPDGVYDDVLKGIGMERNDTLIDGTEEKAKFMSLSKNGLDVSYDDLVLEMVAMTDVMKA